METIELIDYISSAGLVTILLIILFAGAKGLWVFGRYYERERRRADVLQRMLFQAQGMHEESLRILDEVSRHDRSH